MDDGSIRLARARLNALLLLAAAGEAAGGVPTSGPEASTLAAPDSECVAQAQALGMNEFVNGGRFNGRVDARLEVSESQIQPREPADSQQLRTSQSKYARNQSSPGELRGNDRQHPQRCLTVRHEVQSDEL